MQKLFCAGIGFLIGFGIWYLLYYSMQFITPRPPLPRDAFNCAGIAFGVVFAFISVIANNEEPKSIIKSPTKNKESLYPFDWETKRRAVLDRDENACGNCGGSLNLEVHHIVPLAKGGTNKLSNLQTLCKECHSKTHSH